MSHGVNLDGGGAPAAPDAVLPGPLARSSAALAALNRWLTLVCGYALVAASLVLTYGVAMRYVFKVAIDWQDETSIFLIVGAAFLAAAAVQDRRGHVAIEAVAGLLSPRAERWRLLLVDALSLALCAFLAWKSWSQWHESWSGNEHSISSWGPPMWIPYLLMSAGLSLLCLQIAMQVASGFAPRTGHAR